MDNISFYLHIISPEIIDFAKNNQNITIITTESEKNLNKKTISSNVISIPLAIPTYLKSESVQAYEDNKKVIHELLSRATIHLGGLYKNAQNQDVIITDSQFQSIPKDLNLTSKNHVSVIVHPRTFKDVIDKPMQIKKRLLLLTKDGKLNKNMHFFVPKNLYDILNAKENSGLFSGFNIQLSPPYNGVLYAINELQMCEQKQFVSVDQYNAFADIKCKVHGFLLNKSDVNQKKYLNKYNSINLNQDVLKGFLKIVK
ncbi:hypothetical protein [Candidatus Deianiraea vastatrix]|uniref:Uncharacterized protein n=1 Tax=Candidatus Deianiraea vastatrix TaxID=2163644 RepID=A0A5B8XD98_9RICK|nr:hypothetical protein [Candidatus Deianiraea vastatrix]QED23220.1 hypothetical protein Deia_00417 [Candidatus Deianiraea vastatrix]